MDKASTSGCAGRSSSLASFGGGIKDTAIWNVATWWRCASTRFSINIYFAQLTSNYWKTDWLFSLFLVTLITAKPASCAELAQWPLLMSRTSSSEWQDCRYLAISSSLVFLLLLICTCSWCQTLHDLHILSRSHAKFTVCSSNMFLLSDCDLPRNEKSPSFVSSTTSRSTCLERSPKLNLLWRPWTSHAVSSWICRVLFLEFLLFITSCTWFGGATKCID